MCLGIGAVDREAASNSADEKDMAKRSPAEGGVIPAGRVLDLARLPLLLLLLIFRRNDCVESAGSKTVRSDLSRESADDRVLTATALDEETLEKDTA